MSSEPAGSPSEQPGNFDSPPPDSWPHYNPPDGQHPLGQHPPDGHYPLGQHPPDGQHPLGQHPPDGHYPLGQHPPDGQHPLGRHYPLGQYPYQPEFFTPGTVRNNRAAVAALICGIVQFAGGLLLVGNILLAIPAIICGLIALKQIRLRGERGRGMAIAGLVLGILGVVYFLLVLIVILVGVRVTSSSLPAT